MNCTQQGPQDCNPNLNPGGAYCCLRFAETDAGEDAAEASTLGSGCVAAGGRCQSSAIGCTARSAYGCGSDSECCFDGICGSDAASVLIMASSYDQSCTVDTDCVGISEGDSCKACDFTCTNAAINAGAMAKYMSDTENLPAVLAVARMACPSTCGGPEGICCNAGKCHRGAPCPFEVLMGVDAGADTGADADACAPSGCATACPAGTHDVSSVVNGCTVWQCCVPDDAGPEAAIDAAADASAE